jgi:hypothetical protein
VVTRGRSVAIAALVVACGRGPFLVHDADGGGDGDGEDDDDDDDVESFDDADPPEGCDFDGHEHDEDGDGIPDADDPFCDDRGRPGRARTDVIYAHSPATLYTFHPGTLSFELVGPFVVDGGGAPQVTDIAIDRFGVLYAVTFGELHACDPASAECWMLGPLPTNSLGFAPIGSVQGDDDTMITVAGSTFVQVALVGPSATEIRLSSVQPYSSSGDVTSLRDGTTLFTSPSPSGVDAIVQVDPANGGVLGERTAADGSSAAYGLATFADHLYIFDQLGQILRFDPLTGGVEFTTLGPEGWWGAATHPDAW